MKKTFLIGVFIIPLLLISNVTAIPQTSSDPLMKIINEIEHNKNYLNDKYEISINNIKDISYGIIPAGLIDFLIQLFTFIINLINFIINIVQTINTIINLITMLTNTLIIFMETIDQLIEWLRNLNNPELSMIKHNFIY